MLVTNLISTKGNKVPNQFAIELEDANYFQSYESTCAKVADEVKGMEIAKNYYGNFYERPVIKKVLTLGHDWDYSKTTVKYLKQFLKIYCPEYCSKTVKELRALIASGEIKYDPNMY